MQGPSYSYLPPTASRGPATPAGAGPAEPAEAASVDTAPAGAQGDNVEILQTQFESLRQKYGAADSVAARALLVDSMTPVVKQLDAIHAQLSQKLSQGKPA